MSSSIHWNPVVMKNMHPKNSCQRNIISPVKPTCPSPFRVWCPYSWNSSYPTPAFDWSLLTRIHDVFTENILAISKQILSHWSRSQSAAVSLSQQRILYIRHILTPLPKGPILSRQTRMLFWGIKIKKYDNYRWWNVQEVGRWRVCMVRHYLIGSLERLLNRLMSKRRMWAVFNSSLLVQSNFSV